ncbi:MAG: alpha/beta hydrolase [Deltaproteobacteria bacterium]|nr:alpha/beta hydrolase [Deltaproteobacteria bacterium]
MSPPRDSSVPGDLYEGAGRVSLSTDAGPVHVTALAAEGSGPDRFLLLHGNPGSMLDLAPLLEPLRSIGEVAAYDAPGFGRSPAPADSRALGLDAFAEVAVRMLDHLGWSDAILIGHSHGGGVAQRVAHRWHGRVRGLVLLATLGAPAHLTYRVFPLPGVEAALAVVGRLLPYLPRPVGEGLVGYFMKETYAPSRVGLDAVQKQYTFLARSPHVLKNMARVTKGSPCDVLEGGAHDIQTPTVFVHGAADSVVPIRHARGIYERMERAGRPVRFVAMDGVGHMIAEQEPRRCVRAIRELVEMT